MVTEKQHSAGIYVHIPFCASKCRYCDFPSFVGMEDYFEAYTRAVCREIRMKHQALGPLQVDTVFFGGGTPSFLPACHLSDIFNTLVKSFAIDSKAEITLEANPGTMTHEKVRIYRELGFNRISIGLQAAQDKLLRFMGRIHTVGMFSECINRVKRYGFDNINADIIFGVPTQTMKEWQETLDLVREAGLTHISCYSLQIEENTCWYEMRKKGLLPMAEEPLEREMYYKAIEVLRQAGFEHYEISNFARPGFECRHNLKYWSHAPYYGIGAAAHSFRAHERIENLTHPIDYIQCLQEGRMPRKNQCIIGPEEELSESFILGLRCIKGISINDLVRKYGKEAVFSYMGKIEALKKKQLVAFNGDRLTLTGRGLDYANQVWMEFI